MAVLLGGVALIQTQSRFLDPDTWWHITVGEHILRSHAWPMSDPYSFTAHGGDWIAYEWLGEVVMALAARAGGLAGVALLQRALVALLALLLYYYAYLRSGKAKAACFAAALLLPVAGVIFTLRPQLLAYIFLLVTLICLEQFRHGHTRALWFLPLVFLLWVNTHGTFVIGLAMIGLYWASGTVSFQAGGLVAERMMPRQRIQLLSAFLFCTLALLVTPYGSRLAAYPLQMAISQPLVTSNIQEWQPLTFSMPLGKYLLALLLALFVAQVVFRLSYRLEELAMLVLAVYATCVHIRFAMVFAILLAPIVASVLARWVSPYDPAKDHYFLNVAIIVLVVVGLARVLPSKRELDNMVAKEYPVGAVDYLRHHPEPTGMFNEYFWGGYLISQLGPEHKVFIDGRADLYEYSGVLRDYSEIVSMNRDAMRLLDKYGIQSCLVNRHGSVTTLLSASPDWKVVYSDDLSTIFVRNRNVPSPQGSPRAAYQNSRVSEASPNLSRGRK